MVVGRQKDCPQSPQEGSRRDATRKKRSRGRHRNVIRARIHGTWARTWPSLAQVSFHRYSDDRPRRPLILYSHSSSVGPRILSFSF